MSETHFRLLIDAVQGAIRDYVISLVDPEGRIVTWNEGARRQTGYADDEIIGQPNICLYPPEAVAAGKPARLLAQAAAEGRAEDQGWRIRKDGSQFFADMVFNAMHDEAGTLLGFAVVSRDVTERARQQEALRMSEELLNRAQRLARMGSDIRDPRTGERQWSEECYRIFGVSPKTFEPTPENVLQLIHPDDRPIIIAQRAQMAEGVCPKPAEYRIVRPDGSICHVFREWEFIRDDSGAPAQLLGTIHDVTEQRRNEAQLQRSRKLESVGKLAGGMAHDFNNLLGIVIANLDLAMEEAGANGELRELIDEALTAALRGAELTHRLLAFARRQPLRPVQVELNELVKNTAALLEHLLGEDVEISVDLGADLWPVIADPAQIEASLTNLATNARDAMPEGGKLFFRTRNSELDVDYAAEHAEVTAGDFAMIEVTDTGSGIAPEDLDRVFEPFFTTKEQGKGTGLGLSMVLGFAKQSGGHLSVYSEPGLGTTFRLYLPRITVAPIVDEPLDAEMETGGGETVLVVEDNEALRRAATRQIRGLGYYVLECDRAEVALDILATERIDLLFSDIVMPGRMNGVQLAQRVQERWPAVKVLLTSGFPQARIESGDISFAGLQLLGKPYRREELAAALRAVLLG